MKRYCQKFYENRRGKYETTEVTEETIKLEFCKAGLEPCENAGKAATPKGCPIKGAHKARGF
jgi:hypothetical protein